MTRQGSPRYLNGSQNKLMIESQPEDRQVGEWSPEQLIRMNSDFVAAVERAFRLGREQRASASACVRAGAGDGDRLSLAS